MMKAVCLIRNVLLIGSCVGFLAGCSWLENWPPKGSEMARKAAPKPPHSKVVQRNNGTWLSNSKTTTANLGKSKGLSLDKGAEARIALLEKSIDDIRNDLKMMMPALTKLAAAQGGIQQLMSDIEPAAGGASMAPSAPASLGMGRNNGGPTPVASVANYRTMQQGGNPTQPGSVSWYEKQEKMKRQAQQQQSYQKQGYQQQGYYNKQPVASQAYQKKPQQEGYQQARQQTYQQAPRQQGYQQQSYQKQGYQQQGYQQPLMQKASYGGSGASVTNVRFGEHPDKTRLVLDTSNKVSFSYDIDNREQILMISLPGTGWNTAREMAVRNSPLVRSYNIISDNAGGQQLIMQLKQPVKVLWAQNLMPSGAQGYRVVFDLAPL